MAKLGFDQLATQLLTPSMVVILQLVMLALAARAPQMANAATTALAIHEVLCILKPSDFCRHILHGFRMSDVMLARLAPPVKIKAG
jgi:hypothetical protein